MTTSGEEILGQRVRVGKKACSQGDHGIKSKKERCRVAESLLGSITILLGANNNLASKVFVEAPHRAGKYTPR